MLLLNAFIFVVITLIGNRALEIPISEQYDYNEMYYNLLNSKDVNSYREIQKRYIKDIMNLTVDPCDDFYEYSCGNWKNIVAKDVNKTAYGTFNSMDRGNNYVLSKLFSKEIESSENVASKKLKLFYKTCTDKSTWDYEELAKFLNSLGSWPLTNESWSADDFDWVRLTAEAHLCGANVIFKQWLKDSARPFKINHFDLIEKTPHQKLCDKEKISNEESYVEEVKKIFNLMSINLDGKENMIVEVYEFEKKLVYLKEEYKKFGEIKPAILTSEELEEQIPDFNFNKYFRILGDGKLLESSQMVLILKLQALKDTFDLVIETDPRIIANNIFINIALKFHLYIKENLSKNLKESCASLIKNKLIAAAVYIFANEYYDEEVKEVFSDMYTNILQAGRKVINSSNWIDTKTKSKALDKFNSAKKQIGFNEDFLDVFILNSEYEKLNINETNFIRNLIEVFRFSLGQEQKIPIGLGWLHDPFEVNAAFLQGTAIMDVPVGIMQPPSFHKFSPRYLNYGSLGSIIGHELMHGFDTSGIKYDSEGEQTQWFNVRLKLAYFTKMECFYSQYNRYQPEGVNRTVDGGQTLGENISDNQGLKIALTAYKNWLNTYNDSNEIDVGLTDNGDLDLNNIQAFFLGYSQFWCSVISSEKLLHQIKSDPHAPNKVRVHGVLSNSLDFAEAFRCPVGSYMNPEKKCNYMRK